MNVSNFLMAFICLGANVALFLSALTNQTRKERFVTSYVALALAMLLLWTAT